MKTKKGGKLAFFIILILGLGTVFFVLFQAFRVSEALDRPFVPERRMTAERLYRETLGQNVEENFPTTIRGVMEFYATTVQFLYGDFIATDEMFLRVVEFLRLFMHDEITSQQSAMQQVEIIRRDAERKREAGVLHRRPEIGEITIDYHEGRSALVRVVQPFSFYPNLYRLYILRQNDENDRWQIYSWRETDEYFEGFYQ